MNNKSIIDEAIEQMQQKMADSRGNRTGDYRIGLYDAINILENIKLMERRQAQEYAEFCVICDRNNLPLLDFESFIATYGGNK